ncbi:LLM class F420-dependent oxidoreductase [Kineococcus indalonis]|uniref:LLM class F420-dependent oxidoreductase n=1 Tax=Kineococcus indalonis TaxID=2696566 RepID=UPI0014136F69|nr:LLM class F420-dependent oxidoreductase [Kineococcus indalonis]NAZ84769.1 TIGR03560 family F420-dependent LLM class oxidoreductase [Kineococcus indalonis]
MDIALHVADFTPFGGDDRIAAGLAATARAADAAGFRTLTLMDHWFQMEATAPATDPMLEGYTALGYLAGQTQHLQLGLLVTGVTYRHPGLLAKTVATLDVLSGGRALLGIGAAWYEREHAGLGVPFPPLAERFERLEEALAVCRQMWGEDDGPFEGRHYRLAETLCRPRPLRPGGPPVLIGGSGERKTLRLVAEHAQACNLYDAGPDVLAHKLQVLDRHCTDVGRDPAEVQRTVITGTDPLADTDAFLSSVGAFARLGVSQVWVSPHGVDDLPGWVARVGERVVPRLREL